MIEVDSIVVMLIFLTCFYFGFRIGSKEEYRPDLFLKVFFLLFLCAILAIVCENNEFRYFASYREAIMPLFLLVLFGGITGAVFVLNERRACKYHIAITVEQDFSICGKEYKAGDCLYTKYSDSKELKGELKN